MPTSRTGRGSDLTAPLATIDRRYGPRPGRATKPVVLVLDDGRVHTSKLTTNALAARPWLTMGWLPTCAPELDDIELAWRDLKRHHPAHRIFSDADHLDRTIHQAVEALNRERAKTHPGDDLRIAAWCGCRGKEPHAVRALIGGGGGIGAAIAYVSAGGRSTRS